MAHSLFRRLFRRVHGLAGAETVTDAALIEDYVARGEQKAFELLVWRHGAMVLQTCRRIVGCADEAEDAMQAVFWILARKASTIRRREALPGWLHRIAVRVALVAKKRRGRFPTLDPAAEPARAALERNPGLDLLDEELNRLPAKYRVPIVLCHLQQKSSAEAAQELGIPPGTLFSRLARGREKLRVRLQRRGLEVGAGAALVLEQSVQAAPSCAAPLVERTVAGALAFVATRSAELSRPVLVLAKGVLHAMWLRNIALVSAVVMLIGSVITGAWFAVPPAAAQIQKPAGVPDEPKKSKLPELLKKRYESALRTYDAATEVFRAGRDGPDVCYQWSLKVLEAQLDWKPADRVKAHVAHRDRMRPVYDLMKARYNLGNKGAFDYGIAEHGLFEAELWLEREQAKK